MAGPLKDTRKRKYQEELIKYGFISIAINGDARPQNVICCEVLVLVPSAGTLRYLQKNT
jgi:hypothetical protein